MAQIDPEEREFALRLGALIAKVRLDNDVSQEDLADALDVSVSTVGRWERGTNPPKSYQLAKIWNALKQPPAKWLLDPPDAMSELDRRIAERVETGRSAAYRPRRRATKRAADAPAEQPAPRRVQGRRGSQ